MSCVDSVWIKFAYYISVTSSVWHTLYARMSSSLTTKTISPWLKWLLPSLRTHSRWNLLLWLRFGFCLDFSPVSFVKTSVTLCLPSFLLRSPFPNLCGSVRESLPLLSYYLSLRSSFTVSSDTNCAIVVHFCFISVCFFHVCSVSVFCPGSGIHFSQLFVCGTTPTWHTP